MDYRIRKQITIVAIVVLFFVIAGAWLYFVLKPEPTCLDGIKNQDEEEIDCGGKVCPSCEIKTINQPEVFWVKAISSGGDFYDLVAKIRNPNPNFGAAEMKYYFEIKDKDGQIIGRKEGTTFILPGSAKYIIETNFESKEKIEMADLKIETIETDEWIKLKDYQSPEFFVKDKKFTVASQPSYVAEASGTIQNNTFFDFDKIYISVVVFNKYEEAIGVSESEARTMISGEGRYFSTKWFNPFEGEVNSIDIQAETNLFLDGNFMRKFGEPGAFTE